MDKYLADKTSRFRLPIISEREKSRLTCFPKATAIDQAFTNFFGLDFDGIHLTAVSQPLVSVQMY